MTPAVHRLSSARAIRRVFAEGERAGDGAVSIHARPRPGGGPWRAAVVAGRRVGRAVDRNRAKRRLRAALRAAEPPTGVDLVVVGRAPVLALPYGELAARVAAFVAATTDAHGRTERSRGAR